METRTNTNSSRSTMRLTLSQDTSPRTISPSTRHIGVFWRKLGAWEAIHECILRRRRLRIAMAMTSRAPAPAASRHPRPVTPPPVGGHQAMDIRGQTELGTTPTETFPLAFSDRPGSCRRRLWWAALSSIVADRVGIPVPTVVEQGTAVSALNPRYELRRRNPIWRIVGRTILTSQFPEGGWEWKALRAEAVRLEGIAIAWLPSPREWSHLRPKGVAARGLAPRLPIFARRLRDRRRPQTSSESGFS